MNSQYRVDLPWPNPALLPNKANKLNKRALFDVWKAARETAFLTVKNDSPCGCLLPAYPWQATYIFSPPDRRQPDLDNLVASIKHYQDGVCRALEVDDKQIRRLIVEPGQPVPDGCVTLILETLQPFTNEQILRGALQQIADWQQDNPLSRAFHLDLISYAQSILEDLYGPATISKEQSG